MSKQIQIRRGTTAQHENFTGAPGEITMDTDMNTLRVHDGKTPGGTILARMSDTTGTRSIANDVADYVIEYQQPDASNNYTWYRKYKSGWTEQGGTIIPSADTDNRITMPVKMADANYTVIKTATQNDKTAINTTATNDAATSYNWYACGLADTTTAQEQ